MSDLITVRCYGRDGFLVDVVGGVSLGDRVAAAAQGVESLHTAALWGAVAADRALGLQPTLFDREEASAS